jgi:hypothetical protein
MPCYQICYQKILVKSPCTQTNTTVSLNENTIQTNAAKSKNNKYEYLCLDATKAFFREAVSEKTTCTSVLAKIALVAFPIIIALIALEVAFDLAVAPITFLANWIGNASSQPLPHDDEFDAKTQPVASTEVESTEVASTEVESTEVASTEVESTEVESTEVESTEVESTEVTEKK